MGVVKVETHVLKKGVESNPFDYVLKCGCFVVGVGFLNVFFFPELILFHEHFLVFPVSIYICWEILTGGMHGDRAYLDDLIHDSGEVTYQELICRHLPVIFIISWKRSKKSPLCLYMFNFLVLNFTLFVEEITFFILHLYSACYGNLLISA